MTKVFSSERCPLIRSFFRSADNIGLIASKTCGTGIRGKYYAIAAAMGKVGAFIGTYIFPHIEKAGGPPGSVKYGQYPFFVASSLCFLSACLVWLLPRIDQVCYYPLAWILCVRN